MADIPKPLPRAGLLLFGTLAALALLATGYYLARGDYNSGDLYQHHVAGELWGGGQTRAVYRGNVLGPRIDAWQQARFPDKSHSPRDQFNYLYPPLCAILSAQFSAFSFTTWGRAWMVFSLAAYAAALFLTARLYPATWRNPVAVLALLAFPPLHYTLYIGQWTPLTLLILTSGCCLLSRQRPIVSGFVVSLLFYKPQLLPWLGLFMLLAGSWKFVFGLGVGTLFWLALGVTLAGWQAHLDWLACLREMAAGVQFTRTGVNLSLRGMLESLTGSSGTLVQVLAWGGGLAGLAAAARWRSDPHTPLSDSTHLAWGIAVCQLVSPYVCHYDYLLVLPWMIASWPLLSSARLGTLSLLLLWLAGLVSIAGLLGHWPYAGILLAGWLVWTILNTTAHGRRHKDGSACRCESDPHR